MEFVLLCLCAQSPSGSPRERYIEANLLLDAMIWKRRQRIIMMGLMASGKEDNAIRSLEHFLVL